MGEDSKISSSPSSAAKVVADVPSEKRCAEKRCVEKGTESNGKGNPEKKKKKIQNKAETSAEKSAFLGMEDVHPPLHIYERYPQKRILPEDSKTLYATNLVHPVGRKLVKADLEKFFQDLGKVDKVTFQDIPGIMGAPEFAKIEFESHDVTKRAFQEKHGCVLLGTIVKLNGIQVNGPVYDRTDCTEDRPIIIVSGFGKTILGCDLEKELKKYFSSCGVVAWVSAPVDGVEFFSTGCAYIKFEKDENFFKALKLDGAMFLGFRLKVRRAQVFVTGKCC